MAKFKKCFERFEGGYREIPYSRLFVDGKRSPEYVGRYFIPLDGYLMEVPQQDYVDFYKGIRRGKYIHEESSLHGEIFYSSVGDDELNGEELIRDIFIDVADEAITSVMVHKLREVLLQLSGKKLELITALFFHRKSEREWSDETIIPRMTICNRKNRIIAKLKKIMEK